MRKTLIAAAFAALALPAFGPAARAAEPAVTWTPDLVHSRAEFTVSHMVVSKVWGHIPITQLTVVAPKGSVIPERLEATLNVAHEDTDNHDRDADLRSATYFDTAKYPTITFKSTKITQTGKDDFTVTGDLTIKDITKPVSFPVHVEGRIPDESGGTRVGYSSDLKIDRRDWHLVDQRLTPAGVLLVGYDVHIGLTVEAVTPDASLHGK
jgi:polyisoprenoid-binding protein YceI